MTALQSALRQISARLEEADVPFALVGGLAVSARTQPRFTRDADIAVAVTSDAEAERLVGTLQREYVVIAVVEQEAVGRLATVRLSGSTGPFNPVIDLLFASSGIEPEVVAAAERIELLPRLDIRVATVGHLIALKILARDDVTRPQDFTDLRALLRVASAVDLSRAQAALKLIAERGYHRGRDLQTDFEHLISPSGSR